MTLGKLTTANDPLMVGDVAEAFDILKKHTDMNEKNDVGGSMLSLVNILVSDFRAMKVKEEDLDPRALDPNLLHTVAHANHAVQISVALIAHLHLRLLELNDVAAPAEKVGGIHDYRHFNTTD